VLAGFSIPLRFALGRLLALLMKAHHKLALVPSRKRGKKSAKFGFKQESVA
jgi:hypothetical protein